MHTELKPDLDYATATDPVARTLQLAATTSEQLVADAEVRAAALVAVAQAQADAIEQASLEEAGQAALMLAHAQREQAAELERERLATLAELTKTRAELESQIGDLRKLESFYRERLRLFFTEQLSLLDTSAP